MESSGANLGRGATAIVAVIDRRLLHEEVVDRLRDLIVEGGITPGTRLQERQLCDRFGVSRTPLREAIKTLASEGLVVLQPNRSAVVAALTAEVVREIAELLGPLEALAGELACVRATAQQIAEIAAMHYEMRACHARGDLPGYFRLNQRIHQGIVDATGNSTLAATYRALNDRIKRARYAANLSRERWGQAVREHDEILARLERRDAPGLRQLLEAHLRRKLEVFGALAPELRTAVAAVA